MKTDNTLKEKDTQELVQTEPKSSTRNQNGGKNELQISRSQKEHTVNRVSSSFSKGDHSAT